MRQPTKPKPQAFEEVARVLNVYTMLAEELAKRQPFGVVTDEPITNDSRIRIGDIRTLPTQVTGDAILAVSERIAARTEG